jgi:hypothetical protein
MKLLASSLAVLIARVSLALSRVAAALLRLAKPGPAPAPAASAAAPAPSFRLPSPEDPDRARGHCALADMPGVKICRGPARGCASAPHEQPRCANCYIVPWHDRRPSAEILAAMERGDA